MPNTTTQIETPELTQELLDRMSLADELGRIDAQLAPLQKLQKRLKAQLVQCGQSPIDGFDYRVTVSHSNRVTLDREVLERLVPKETLKLATKTSNVTTVRCTSLRTS